jgi:hypothetical protein
MSIPLGFCHCGCGQKTAIAKKTQASQADIAGQPRKFVRFHQPKPGRPRLTDEQFIEALWAKVDKSPGQGPKGDCWCFTGATDDDGYGVMRRTGYPPQRVHRVILSVNLGRNLLPGEQALHRCDNPPCARPDHIFQGSNTDNIADRHKKGRTHISIPQRIIDEIRACYIPRQVSTYALARQFDIAPSYVWMIVKGQRRAKGPVE